MPADTLILAWGNPGRLDDGLGPALAEAVADMGLPKVEVISDYQLQVEHAAEIADRRTVIFADADRQGSAPFSLERIHAAANGLGFSTHSVSPAALLALARDLFDCEPEAWLLGIRGYEFDDFGERISAGARENLAAAVAHLEAAVRSGRLLEVRRGTGRPDSALKSKVNHV